MATKTLNTPVANLLADERWVKLRSHKRIISRVKLMVEWGDGTARQMANAVTVDVSHSGCMAIVGAPLPMHQKVRLIQHETGREAEAEVVWRAREAWEVGLELAKPDATFWGLKFCTCLPLPALP